MIGGFHRQSKVDIIRGSAVESEDASSVECVHCLLRTMPPKVRHKQCTRGLLRVWSHSCAVSWDHELRFVLVDTCHMADVAYRRSQCCSQNDCVAAFPVQTCPSHTRTARRRRPRRCPQLGGSKGESLIIVVRDVSKTVRHCLEADELPLLSLL